MNTMVNTPSRRPSSIFGYEKIVKDRNTRVSEENAAREKEEQQALLSAEEQKRLALEEEMTTAQKFINTLCESIQRNYTAMIDAGKKMRRNQDELAEKQKEEQLSHETSDELYKYVEVDKSLSRKMSLRRIAYYAYPILDCFFAFFALFPIVTSKFVDVGSAVAVGFVSSFVVGFLISLLSRWGCSSIDDNESSDFMRALKKLAIVGGIISLPMMYIISEISFNGGTNWTYSGVLVVSEDIIYKAVIDLYVLGKAVIIEFRLTDDFPGSCVNFFKCYDAVGRKLRVTSSCRFINDDVFVPWIVYQQLLEISRLMKSDVAFSCRLACICEFE